jgi:hypothetical protein
MDVAIVYESLFGNTRRVAEAIAEGFLGSRPDARVAVMDVDEASAGQVRQADLLVVGGPTHMLRMTTAHSRDVGMRSGEGKAGAKAASRHSKDGTTAKGVREWLKALPAAPPGQQAAAFDTRLASPLAGGAARSISRRLQDGGYEVVAEPKGFIVRDGRGPLRAGEEERARMWGVKLARRCSGEWLRGISGDAGT